MTSPSAPSRLARAGALPASVQGFDEVTLSGLVDPDADEPLYQQVKRIILRRLSSSTLHPGRPLPSSRYLAATLGVSRNTVNFAYQELTALGYLESRPRSGIYPTTRLPEIAAFPPAVEAPAVSSVDWTARLPSAPDLRLAERTTHPRWFDFPYPFLPGQPELEAFPARAWLRVLGDALSGEHRAYSLSDRTGQDDALLVETIRRDILEPRGVIAAPENILITHGSQNALALLSRVLLRNGAVVAMGDPGYLDAAHTFLRAGARLDLVPVDGHGVVLEGTAGFDAVYLTPSHHHPTNATLSLRRRQEVIARAEAEDFLIIEDDYDSEVRFRGRPTPTVFSLDAARRTMYLGTFSKFLAPGLRVGYVVAPAELIAALRIERDYDTKHPSGHLQRALALFIASGDYHRALRLHRTLLAQKFALLFSELRAELGWIPPHPPAGGLSLWLRGPEGFDSEDVARRARLRGVLVDPGSSFSLRPRGAPQDGNPDRQTRRAEAGRRHLRVGFNSISSAAIPAGVRELAAAVRESAAGTDASG